MSKRHLAIFCTLFAICALAHTARAENNAILDNVAGANDTSSARRQQPEPSIAINPLEPVREVSELRQWVGR